MFKVRRWLRWLVYLPLGLAGWALAALLWLGPKWVESELPARLEAALGDKKVKIGAVESDLLRLSFQVRDLSITTADGREIFACPDVRLRATWSALMGGEREVSSVKLTGPVVRLREGAEGWLSDWRLAAPEGAAKPLRISGIEVSQGTVEVSRLGKEPVSLRGVELSVEDFDSELGADVTFSTLLGATGKVVLEGRHDVKGPKVFAGKVSAEGLTPGDLAPWVGKRTEFWQEGTLAFSGKVVGETTGETVVWSLAEGSASVDKPRLRHLETLMLQADAASATGVASADLSKGLEVGSVTVSGGGLSGVIPAASATPAASPAVYQWNVGKAEWKGWGLSLETSGKNPRRLEVENLNVAVDRFGSRWEAQALFLGPLALPGQTWSLTGGFSGGSLQAEGKGGSVVLRLRDASLAALRPWLSLPAELQNLGGKGSLGVTLSNAGNRWSASVLGELAEPAYDYPGLGRQRAAYVRVEASLAGTRDDFTPTEFSTDLRARGVRILLRRKPDLSFETPWEAFMTGTGATKWKLGRLILEDAEIDHEDQGVAPVFRGVWQVHGELGETGAEGLRPFEARGGLAGNPGVVRLKGSADFSSFRERLQMEASVTGFDLRPLSAWCEHYTSRPLLGGTLDWISRLEVVKGKLKATNDFRLTETVFGQPSRKELSTDVPLARMVNLLRDRKGLVKLSLPVEGDVGQPDFRYSSSVWAALRRTSTRMLTAPLRALGELFSEDRPSLGEVERMVFGPVQTELPEAAKPLLTNLASFLRDRPGISLVISGGAAHSESHLLREEALQMMLEDSLGRPPRTFQEYERVLRGEFEKAFPGELNRTAETLPAGPEASPGTASKPGFWARLFGRKAENPPSPPPLPPRPSGPGLASIPHPLDPLPPEMEERLLETIVVPISALDELAVLRAKTVRAFLVSAGVEASRLQVVEHSTENAPSVRLRLP